MTPIGQMCGHGVTWVADEKFNSACGPGNLAEALHSFRVWVYTEDGEEG